MRRNQLGLKASNVLLSTGVVAIFIYLLILAMAQDQILAKLSRGADFANYSSSLLDAREAKKTSARIDKLADDRQKLRKQIAVLKHRGAVAELAYLREAVRLDSIFKKFNGKDCPIRDKAKPAPTVAGRQEPERPAERAEPATAQQKLERLAKQAELAAARRKLERQAMHSELAAARLCFAVDPKFGGEGRNVYMAILGNAQRLSDAMVRIEIASAVKDQENFTLGEEINRQVNDREKLAPARVHFTVLESLETDWAPTNFVNYPPFIIHVLLSFFSGTFGALLITMVFVVYPSKLRERVSAKLYYKRVFLGGLVAVTVFIVLTGGASILGTSEVSDDGANVMSFTAIGLLAGMFSDTVADWLSARAKTMFSSEDDGDGKRGRDDPSDGDPARTG